MKLPGIFLMVCGLISFMIWGSSPLSAQDKKGSIEVEAVFHSSVELPSQSVKAMMFGNGNGTYVYPLEAATVLLVQGQDTLKYLSTDVDGYCTFKNIPYGTYQVIIQYTGYETFQTPLEHRQGKSTVSAVMKESAFILDAIKVKGKIPLVIAKADTLIVNPKAVQTRQGAAALEIIRQVPGIEISPGGTIMAFGKALSRTYVGGQAIFGRDFMAALKNIDADMVKDIKFYDEDEHVSWVNGKQITRKVRAMNIETTRAFLASFAGHVLAGAGKDLGNGDKADDRVRYKGGLSFAMNSVKLAVKGDAFYNNVGLRNSASGFMDELLSSRFTGEQKLGGASVSAERRFGEVYSDGSKISFKYDYGHEDMSNESLRERVYDPTADYLERLYSSGSRSGSLHNRHEFNLDYRKSSSKRLVNYLEFNHATSFGDGREEALSFYDQRIDAQPERMQDSTSAHTRSWRTSQRVHISFDGKMDGSLSATFNMGQSKGDSFRKLDENSAFSDYRSSPIGKHLKAGLDGHLSLKSWNREEYSKESRGCTLGYKDFTYLHMDLSSDYNRERNRRVRYDITQPQHPLLDSLNSGIYSYDYWKNRIELSFSKDISYHKQNSNSWYSFFRFVLHAALEHIVLNDTEQLSGGLYCRNYIAPNVFLNLAYKNLYFDYMLSQEVPAMEMVRDRVNDANPLYLTSGNPNLKFPQRHNLGLNWNLGDPFSSSNYFSVTGEVTFTRNSIVPYTVFYKDGTVLEDHDHYRVAPGATFSTYRNVKRSLESFLRVGYTNRIPALRTKYEVMLTGAYRQRPSYVQDRLNITDNWEGAFEFSFNTALRWLSLDLSSRTSYNSSRNTQMAGYEYFNQSVDAKVNVDICKIWYINAAYRFIYNLPVGGTQGILNRNNILNASTGVKLFKGRLTAGVSVFDILDSSTDFRTMRYSDYLQNTWQATFGRYISFDILFNLRKYR